MILAGDKAGHPWHGVWSAATGKITTSGAVEIDLPGVDPSGIIVDGTVEFPPGDAIRVAIPGQPSVTTTAEETAEGKTWLNYGILSGARHRIYGVNLGYRHWIYVAPDKSVWKASLTYSPGYGDVSVDFIRFGDFTPGADTGECTATDSHGSGMTPDGYWMIDDISPDGSTILVSLFFIMGDVDSIGTDSLRSGARVCSGGIRIDVEGTPPDVSVTATVMALPGDAYELIEHEIDSAYPSPYSETVTIRALIGLAFDATGGPCKIYEEMHDEYVVTQDEETYEYYMGDPPEGPFEAVNIQRDLVGSCYYRILFGETIVAEITGSCAMHGESDSFHDNRLTGAEWAALQTLSRTWSFGEYSGSFDESIQWFAGDSEGSPLYSMWSVLQMFTFGDDIRIVRTKTGIGDEPLKYFVVPCRFGNGLFSVAVVTFEISSSDVLEVVYETVVSAGGVDTDRISASGLAGHFATRHPVTRQITRSATPVCVV